LTAAVTARRCRIGVVATGSRFLPQTAQAVLELSDRLYGDRAPEIAFHPQCFLGDGHFAGSDLDRANAFLEVANDPGFDAVWIARGGYGAGRLAEMVLPRLRAAARAKAYLGYSDAAALLGPLYGLDFPHVAHGPMPADIAREGGDAAVARALAWLVDRDPEALEPTARTGAPTAAFNLSILSTLIGTPWQPDLAGHVLMLEEVSEHMYRIDRLLLHVTSNRAIRRVAGLKLGRCSLIPENDPDFERTEEEVARYWCERSGIPWLGVADIGHDPGNKVVPFGPC
jgi:muramoyltetrapeptide carboxypeptidase